MSAPTQVRPGAAASGGSSSARPTAGRARVAARRGAVAAALLVLAIVLAYSNTLHSPFVFDDDLNIVRNPIVHDLSYFAAPWTVDETVGPPELVYGFQSRYLAYLTFAVNYRLHDERVVGYHLVNLAIHVAAALLLAAATRRLVLLPAFANSEVRGRERTLALLVAALFALHPLQTQAVTYIVQRMASLAGLFCLVSLWAYLAARASANARDRRLLAMLHVLSFAAAAATKQNSVTFVFVVVLLEIFVIGAGPRQSRRWLALQLVNLASVLALSSWASQSMPSALNEIDTESFASELGAREYVLTQARVLVTYLRLSVLPIGQNLDYDYPVVRSWLEPAFLASFGLLAFLFGLGAWLLCRRSAGDPAWRLVGLGLLWFFSMHAVESSGVAVLDLIFEHRMYLPSIGLFLAFVVALVLVVPERLRRLSLVASLAGLLVLGAATWARNEVWRSELRLWHDVLAKSPRKARVLNAVGERLLELRRVEEAEKYFLRALELEPRSVGALVQLAVIARVERDATRAEELFRRALEINPDHWIALVNLGDLALARSDRQAAAALFERAAAKEELSTIARQRLERLRAGDPASDGGAPEALRAEEP